MYRVGVDVGGTNIAIGLVDPDLKIMKRDNIKTGSAKEPGEMVEAIAGKVAGLIKDSGLKESDIEMVGVGVPGTAELSSGKILYANNLGFEDVPFLPMLKDALGKELGEKTFFENDANAAAIGEYIAGDYHEDSFVMVTIGTGIGGGIIINGKLLRGCNYAAAEFGHMSIDIDGCDCNCGRKGCFEDYASATSLMKYAREAMTKAGPEGTALWRKIDKIEEVSGEIFFEAVREKDPVAVEVLDKYVGYLSEGITNLINILQPQVLVLTGGITRAADLFLDDLKEKVGRSIYSRSSTINTEIVVGRGIKDAGDAGIIGAALIDKM